MAIKHEIRVNGKGDTKVVTLNARKAIMAFCRECFAWEISPRKCTTTLCPLYPFRIHGTPKDTV